MKLSTILGYVAIIGVGIMIYQGYSNARKEGDKIKIGKKQ